MARQPVPQIGRPTPIQPVAAPVSTYVEPPTPAPSNLHQLAQGLAAFDSGLKGWMEKREAEQKKADAVRGEAAFNRNNQAGWAAGVASGEIPANASPIFMESFKKTEGNYKGIKMRESFSQAYTLWEGRNSDDPAVFEQFLSDFISSNIDTDDPFVLEGFNPHVDLLMEQAYKTHSEERSKTVYNAHVNTRAAVIGDTIDHASIQGVSTGEGTSYDLLLADIIQQRQEAMASGVRMEDFDKQVAATIAAKAIEHGDPYLLDLLDEQLPGYDVKFSSLPEYRDLKATTIAALEVEARRQMTEQAQLQKKADEEAEGQIVSTVFKHLSESPLVEVPEEVISAWEVYDPEARVKLANARKTFMDENTMEDPDDIIAIEKLIQDGAGPRDIFELASSGVITDPATFRSLMDRAQKRQEVGVDALSSQTAKRFLTTIKERTTPDETMGLFVPDGLTDEGIEATKDFENMVIDWIISNPDKSVYEREKFLYEAGELVLRRIDREDPNGPQYISPADAERMGAEALLEDVAGIASGAVEDQTSAPLNPLQLLAPPVTWPIGREQPATPAPDKVQIDGTPLVPPKPINSIADVVHAVRDAPKNTPVAHLGRIVGEGVTVPPYNAETLGLFGQDTPPRYENMEEASRLALKQRAESQGYTFEEYSLELWKTVREGLGLSTEYAPPAPPQVQAPGQSQANPEIFSPSGKTFSQTPEIQQVSSVLDLIGNTEGTDKRRGYNETLAYGRLTGGDKDLVSMTLDEIDALQTSMLRHPENTWNSSALGRYQIVRTTLRGLKDELGLSGQEKFTPELQDRLALHLLEGRGLSRWKNGQMSDQAFMDNLSAEWASLPKADGKGTYEGQRVGTDTSGVLMALAPLKQGNQNAALQAIDQVTSEPNLEAYRNIPEGERDQFLQWNSDPVGNHEKNLSEVDPKLASVVRRAQEISGVQFVVGSGKRDEELQRKAVEWGWSKTMDSDHLHGGALDLWPIIEGAVKFDPEAQQEIVKAMRQAAQELGVELDIGADWQSFKDLPHFAIKSA